MSKPERNGMNILEDRDHETSFAEFCRGTPNEQPLCSACGSLNRAKSVVLPIVELSLEGGHDANT